MATNLIANGIITLQLLLPAFNEFADRAELGLRLPLDEKRVTKSYISKNQLSPGAMAVFDGQHQINWNSSTNNPWTGRFLYYDNSNSVAKVERTKLPELAKLKSVIPTNGAREIAERCLKKLGYDLKKANAAPPIVYQWTYDPQQPGEDAVLLPAFGLRWLPEGTREPHWSQILLEMEVSGLTRRITRFEPQPGAAKASSIDLREFTFTTNRIENKLAPRK